MATPSHDKGWKVAIIESVCLSMVFVARMRTQFSTHRIFLRFSCCLFLIFPWSSKHAMQLFPFLVTLQHNCSGNRRHAILFQSSVQEWFLSHLQKKKSKKTCMSFVMKNTGKGTPFFAEFSRFLLLQWKKGLSTTTMLCFMMQFPQNLSGGPISSSSFEVVAVFLVLNSLYYITGKLGLEFFVWNYIVFKSRGRRKKDANSFFKLVEKESSPRNINFFNDLTNCFE